MKEFILKEWDFVIEIGFIQSLDAKAIFGRFFFFKYLNPGD